MGALAACGPRVCGIAHDDNQAGTHARSAAQRSASTHTRTHATKAGNQEGTNKHARTHAPDAGHVEAVHAHGVLGGRVTRVHRQASLEVLPDFLRSRNFFLGLVEVGDRPQDDARPLASVRVLLTSFHLEVLLGSSPPVVQVVLLVLASSRYRQHVAHAREAPPSLQVGVEEENLAGVESAPTTSIPHTHAHTHTHRPAKQQRNAKSDFFHSFTHTCPGSQALSPQTQSTAKQSIFFEQHKRVRT